MVRQIWRAFVVAVQVSLTPVMALGHVAASQSSGPRTIFVPRDDAARDASFVAFRARLLAAAKAGDVPALTSMIAPSVRAFQEPSSPLAVLALWDVQDGKPWRAVISALELGVSKVLDAYVAPALSDMDFGMNQAVVIARDVRLRFEPRADAAVLSTLSMEVVTLDRTHNFDKDLFNHSDSPGGEAAWARVVAPGNRGGYVYGRFVWVKDQLLFVFERIDGQWKLTAVSSGD